MEIVRKLGEKNKDINTKPAVTIAFLGDSVTQGCFEVYTTETGGIETVFDAENAYHTHLRKILNTLFPAAALNIINAGISGGCARGGLERIERDVLRYSPDMCVVCFGLNDTGNYGIEEYKTALTGIFDRLLKEGVEVIFMTPNMMCTKLSCHIKEENIRKVGEGILNNQVSGKLEQYLEAAKEIAVSKNIPVCDCYSKWKMLEKSGVDTTELLANHLNHPTRDMNWLFAYSLVETMFKN